MSVGFRLMLFNCLLLFLPLAGLTFLDLFEGRMLTMQENTMASQARVLAAAAPEAATLTSWAKSSLARLKSQTTTRLRVLNLKGQVLADSSSPGTSRVVRQPQQDADAANTLAYQLGSLPFRLWRAIAPPVAPEEAPDDDATAANPAVKEALNGHYGSLTRVSPGQRSVTLYAALPILSDRGQPLGVVLASQSTWRTLQTLYQIRVSLFEVFLFSLAVALALSFLLSLTITRPLRAMKKMAEGFVDQWGRPQGQFHPVRASGELAGLSRSLVRLGEGLTDHVRFIESFASDLAHEIRNPLASIRAAAELLEGQEDPQARRLVAIVLTEAARIDRVATLGKELGRLDIALARAPREAVAVSELLDQVRESWVLQGAVFDPSTPQASPSGLFALGELGFLHQALDKILENAFSLSPHPKTVSLSWNTDRQAVIVEDRGPGIPDDQKRQVFDRFHTTRRNQGHTGLGLAIARSIVEAFEGRLILEDREGGGTRVIVKLTLS